LLLRIELYFRPGLLVLPAVCNSGDALLLAERPRASDAPTRRCSSELSWKM
jgi:hypothetical protein